MTGCTPPISTISSGKGKYYSSTLSIPQPKLLVSSNLRLEGKVLRFGGTCPDRTTQVFRPNSTSASNRINSTAHPQVGDGVERIDTARNGTQMKYLLGLVFSFLVNDIAGEGGQRRHGQQDADLFSRRKSGSVRRAVAGARDDNRNVHVQAARFYCGQLEYAS